MNGFLAEYVLYYFQDIAVDVQIAGSLKGCSFYRGCDDGVAFQTEIKLTDRRRIIICESE
jgi:hypothetical protein|eukprot:COSAG01_NODE_11557_length_1904_cov_1.053740_1_plen_60_part_00